MVPPSCARPKRALVVVDLPFGSYQASLADAFRAAARVLAEVLQAQEMAW
jgi:ketopantoate hydroxymethyltransferase